MKLIIDIDEKRFKDIQRIASIQIRRRSLTCEQIIANGKPLSEELEKIKAEIQILSFFSRPYNMQMVEMSNVVERIDNHISELKGENNG